MIAPKIVAEVRRLLAERKHSQRSIARLAGVSRGSVGAIASGKCRDHTESREEWEEPAGPPERCPECGGKVYMPCQLCRLREIRKKGPRQTAWGDATRIVEPLGLDLRPEHRIRYEQVRAWRLEEEDEMWLARQ